MKPVLSQPLHVLQLRLRLEIIAQTVTTVPCVQTRSNTYSCTLSLPPFVLLTGLLLIEMLPVIYL